MVRVTRLIGTPLRVVLHAACLTGALAMPAHADLLIPLLFTTPLLLIGALIPTIVVEGLIILARLDIDGRGAPARTDPFSVFGKCPIKKWAPGSIFFSLMLTYTRVESIRLV